MSSTHLSLHYHQEGYGVFTVSSSVRKTVAGYIAGQEQHHRKKTFREEYIEFLEKSGVEYDPKSFGSFAASSKGKFGSNHSRTPPACR